MFPVPAADGHHDRSANTEQETGAKEKIVDGGGQYFNAAIASGSDSFADNNSVCQHINRLTIVPQIDGTR